MTGQARDAASEREWKPGDGYPLPHADSMWNVRSLAEAVLAASTDRGTTNVWLARDLARAALACDDERNSYRIEADCGLRDFDGLELDAGIMLRALEQIADPRPNTRFDPWARDLAREALAEVKDG